MDAIKLMGEAVKKASELTADRQCIGAAKLVVFCNAPEDNPFMAGAFHGPGEPDCEIHVGVSGPGAVRAALARLPKDAPIDQVAELVKRTAFKITRVGQLVANLASKELGVPAGIIDLSLAPTPAVGDSVANILEEMGLETCGCCGTTACLALLNDAVKKGGVMASNHVGGLSGAFHPVSEDDGMIHAAECGCLTIEKLEAMTAVCSVGIDMVIIPATPPLPSSAPSSPTKPPSAWSTARPPPSASSRPSAARRAKCWTSAACWATAPSCRSTSVTPPSSSTAAADSPPRCSR